jgi:hypothetical protein
VVAGHGASVANGGEPVYSVVGSGAHWMNSGLDCHRMWQRTESGRRVRVAPLTRRAGRVQEHEQPGRRRILRASNSPVPGEGRVSRMRRTPLQEVVAGPSAEQDYSAMRLIALRSPCCAQARGVHSMYARSTHASHPCGAAPRGVHAVRRRSAERSGRTARPDEEHSRSTLTLVNASETSSPTDWADHPT